MMTLVLVATTLVMTVTTRVRAPVIARTRTAVAVLVLALVRVLVLVRSSIADRQGPPAGGSGNGGIPVCGVFSGSRVLGVRVARAGVDEEDFARCGVLPDDVVPVTVL